MLLDCSSPDLQETPSQGPGHWNHTASQVQYFVVGQHAHHLSKHCCIWTASTNRHKCLFGLNFKAVVKNVLYCPWVVARGIQRVDTCKRIQHMRLEAHIKIYIWYIYIYIYPTWPVTPFHMTGNGHTNICSRNSTTVICMECWSLWVLQK